MARRTPVDVKKEDLFMRVVVDDAPVFLNVTNHVGKKSPYSTKVKSTVGVRASNQVMAYSLLQVTKSAAKQMMQRPLQIPRGTLTVLEAQALDYVKKDSLADDEIVAVMDKEEYRFASTVDDAGILSLEPQFEDDPYELPPRALRIDFYLRSKKVDRVLAVGFSGHLDRRPGESETRTRTVLKVITNLLALANFSLLTDFNAVDLPMPPAGPPVAPKRKADDRVEFKIPVRLFTEDAQPVMVGEEESEQYPAQGNVSVEIDLDHANASTGQLLYHITPDEALKPAFGPYKDNMANFVTMVVNEVIGDEERRDLTYDIVLGDVSAGAIERMQKATADLGGVDLTPTQHRRH